MPHPTPYSREFDAIRQAFPGLFDVTGRGSHPADTADTRDVVRNIDTTSIVYLCLRRDGVWSIE